MYEPYPDPPVGVTVWHKGREEFCTVVDHQTGDPTSIMVEMDGEWQEVSRAMLERSIFHADNNPAWPPKQKDVE